MGDLEEASLSLEALLMKLGQDGVLLKEGTLQVPLLLSRDGGKTMAVEVVDLVFYGEKERKYLDRMVPVSRVDIRGYPVDPETPELAGLIPDRFFIDRYGRMVEMVTKGDLRIVLAANDRQAIADQRRITQDGRRDPFEKDLVMKLKGEEDEGIQRDKILTLDPKKDPASALTRITEVVEAVETLVREKAPERDVERKYGEFLEQFTELHAAATKSGQQGQEMLVQLMGLKQRADEAYPAPLKVFAEASSVFRRFSQAATAGGKIEEMEKLLDELKALLGDPALIGTTVAEDIQKKLIDPAIDLLEKSRNREDLRKKKLVLEGTTESILQIPVSAELGVDLLGQRLSVGRSNVIVVYAETLALINGNPYRVGDIVQDEDVRVEEITRFGVKVSLKQEIRELPLQ